MEPVASPMKGRRRGWKRSLTRLPVHLYHLRLGRLLTSRFVLLEHRGRWSGATREVVLEVIHQERQPRTVFVASGWGKASQWFQNVVSDPQVRVTIAGERFSAIARVLDPGEAETVLRTYKQRHRIAARGMKRLFGSDDPESLGRVLPVVALEKAAPGSDVGR